MMVQVCNPITEDGGRKMRSSRPTLEFLIWQPPPWVGQWHFVGVLVSMLLLSEKNPWTVASSELRKHFAQFSHLKLCNVPFDRETGFHRGMSWVQFSSKEELQIVLQQENHINDRAKIHVQAQKPKGVQGARTSDAEKDFCADYCTNH